MICFEGLILTILIWLAIIFALLHMWPVALTFALCVFLQARQNSRANIKRGRINDK